MPTYSWPIGRGSSTVSMPRYGHRSDPQTHVAASRMIASVGFSMVGSGRSSTRTSPGAYITVPRMELPLSVAVLCWVVMPVVRSLSGSGWRMSGGENGCGLAGTGYDVDARSWGAEADGRGVTERCEDRSSERDHRERGDAAAEAHERRGETAEREPGNAEERRRGPGGVWVVGQGQRRCGRRSEGGAADECEQRGENDRQRQLQSCSGDEPAGAGRDHRQADQ